MGRLNLVLLLLLAVSCETPARLAVALVAEALVTCAIKRLPVSRVLRVVRALLGNAKEVHDALG